jgi:hypothetical protein
MLLLLRFLRTSVGLALLRFTWRNRRRIFSVLRRLRRSSAALPFRLIRR